MSPLKDQLKTDLTAAMRAKDSLSTGTIRMLLSAITSAEVAGKQAKELSDDEVVTVLVTEQKRRKEAADAFAQAGRTEQSDKELAEAEVIAKYLPTTLTPDELDELIATEVANAEAAGFAGGRAMGLVMKALKPQVAGRADGGEVAQKVKRALGMN